MTSTRYIIHRVNLDIEAPDEPTARRMQDEAARIFHNWILPKLAELLARLVPKDRVLRLDRLDLTLDPMDPGNFEQGFGEAVLSRLTEQVEQLVAATSDTPGQEPARQAAVLTEEERTVAIFLHFLATGQLPWWSERNPAMLEEEPLATLLERTLMSDSSTAATLVALLAFRTTALERLLLQFTPAFTLRLIRLLLFRIDLQADQELARLADILLPRLAVATGESRDDVGLSVDQRRQLFQSLFRWLHDAQTLPKQALPADLMEYLELLVHHRRKIRPGGSRPTPEANGLQHMFQLRHQEPAKQEEPAQQPEPDIDGVHVDHAGLVLLHPFLEYYFREFNLLDDKEFRDEDSRHLAAHLLHYLATGRESPPEYLLSFEKFLCGIELPTPVPRFTELTAAMKEESETLLKAAIGHWQALKSTSPDGLREGFLQRPGKLVTSTFENRLIVESKSHDVLLSSLPWGYGIVKLPWLQRPLIVDWVG